MSGSSGKPSYSSEKKDDFLSLKDDATKMTWELHLDVCVMMGTLSLYVSTPVPLC